MLSKFPNASILTFFTQTEGVQEKLLFIYLKTVPDIYPPNEQIYWYPNAGQKGKANNVWNKLSIKQWIACGKDLNIAELFSCIVDKQIFSINDKNISLTIAQHQIISNNTEQFESRLFDSYMTKNNPLIPKEFYQQENLKFLSGYKMGSEEIKPESILGLFEDDFIYKNLHKDIWGIKEHRIAHLAFRGVRETSIKGIGSKELVGFYQQNFSQTSNYIALVKNEECQEIGRENIDQKSGFFKIDLSKRNQKGKVEILMDKKEEISLKYVLVQEIQINVDTINGVFKDAYDRTFNFTSDKKNKPETLASFTWQRSVFADPKHADQKLSDLFKSIFDYLGPKILIADPYFLGDVKQDETTKPILSANQKALINALAHSAVEHGIIEQVNFLGHWQTTKNQVKKDDTVESNKVDQLFENYERIFKDFISNNKLQRYFSASSIKFCDAQDKFHNRYWFSLSEKEEDDFLDKCVVITNSIGNMNELDILPINDKDQLKTIAREYSQLFKNSNRKLTI